jgi:hypothetical protein
VTLDFEDCNAAHLRWSPNGPAGTGFVEGDMALSRLTAIAGLPCGGATPPAGLYGASIRGGAEDAGATLLLSDDGSAWLFGPAAIRRASSFVFGGSHGGEGSLQLAGASEPAIELGASTDPHPLTVLDLSSLAMEPGESPGSFRAALPGNGTLAFAPLRVDSRYAVYRRHLSMQDLAGRFTAMHGTLSAIHRELILADDGSFSGRDYGQNDGVAPADCNYTGALALVPGTVEFTVEFSAQDCGARDGEYQGRGFFTEVDDYFGVGKWGQLRFAALARDDDGKPRSAFQFEGLRQDVPADGEGE